MKNKKTFLFGLLFSFLIIYQLIGIYNAEAGIYNVPFHVSNNTATSYFPVLSIYGINQDEINLTMSCNAYISGAGSSVCSFNAPMNTTKAISSTSQTGSCVNVGEYNYENKQISTNIESLYSLTSSSSTYQLKPVNTIHVNSQSNTITFIINSSDKDSSKFYKNLISANITFCKACPTSIYKTQITQSYNNLTSCNSNHAPYKAFGNDTYGWGCDGGGDSAYRYLYDVRIFPINSSNSRIIKYNVTLGDVICTVKSGGSCAYTYEIGYFKSGSDTLITLNSSGRSASGTLILDANTVYVFYFYETITAKGDGSGTGNCLIGNGNYTANFTINTAVPVWSCGSYGNCSNGMQSRTCIDTTGVLPDEIESRTCYELPSKSVNIGFENSTSQTIFYPQTNYWAVSCPMIINTKNVDYPNDWTMNNVTNPKINMNESIDVLGVVQLVSPVITGYVYDTLKITNEESFTGTKSLKLWNIPPEQFIPFCQGYTYYGQTGSCFENFTGELNPYGNYTIGQYPEIDKPINESYMVSRDISFGYPNVTISLYLKKCSDVVQQYAGNASIASNILSFLTGGAYDYRNCFNSYYTSDKQPEHIIEPTNLFVYIYDLNNSYNKVLNTRITASSNKWQRYEIRLNNMSVSNSYELALGLSSDNYFDDKNYCLYVDGMDINAYNGAVDCSSRCEGKREYVAIQEGEYSCSYKIIDVSPNCVNDNEKLYIDDCVSFCECDKKLSDYLVYYIADNSTSVCEWDYHLNATYCNNLCKTQNLKQTPEGLEAVGTFLEDIGFGFLVGFLAPFFILMAVFMIIATVITRIAKDWHVFPIVIILFLVVASFIWPVEFGIIGIVITVIVAFLTAKMWNQGGVNNG